MDIISTLERVLLGSEGTKKAAPLPKECIESLDTVAGIEKAAKTRLDAAVNYGGKKSSVKETSRVKNTGRTSRKAPVKEEIEENKEIDDGFYR